MAVQEASRGSQAALGMGMTEATLSLELPSKSTMSDYHEHVIQCRVIGSRSCPNAPSSRKLPRA